MKREEMRRGKGIVDTFTYEGTLEEVLVQFFKKDQSLTYINDSWIDWNDSKFKEIFKEHHSLTFIKITNQNLFKFTKAF